MDQISEGGSAVACVLVPRMIGVETGVNKRLENLVASGVGPFLACECEHAGHNWGCDRCSIHPLWLLRRGVEGVERTAESGSYYAFTP